MEKEDKRFALLIDGENVSAKYIKGILEELSNEGVITYKRIYGDWTSANMQGWKDVLLENSVTPIQQYSYTTGKNATDSAMIIDAMDILYAGNVEGFCLASSDSDFTRLASRLREAGKIVVGMGERKTPSAFIAACNKFKYLEVLQNSEPEAPECPERKEVMENDSAAGGQNTARTSLREIRRAVRTIIDDSSEDDDQWVPLSIVGDTLIKRFPEFDVRNYGHRKLTTFVKALDAFEVREVPSPIDRNTKKIYVRTRPGNRNRRGK
ncbi:NYN domain-containing protein [Intestinimonas sp. MSJ-38]|uniref:NYN domain-containing protein n=1 Tax=Intestinimonas sp. MSJ-38 TaxID=2841532 RepID=UPI001C1010CC|nr:NYN domain-containing protein [Intestinimonas sp. MSJ-38]MBU5431848.1 NYN domain-containing protein [Intestinimonas sp. MSJ-38]